MIDPPRYRCAVVHPIVDRIVGGGPCAGTASFYAKDNRARFAHVCRLCWRNLPADEQALYTEAD
jgi:hypothetical protein